MSTPTPDKSTPTPRPRRTLREQMERKCKHFNGLINDSCRAGVAYADVRVSPEDGPRLLPCFRECDSCPKAEFYTPEELDAKEKEHEESMQRMLLARAAIVSATDGKRGMRGRIPCPNCGKWLAFSVAYNGHVHAQCATPGCCSWME